MAVHVPPLSRSVPSGLVSAQRVRLFCGVHRRRGRQYSIIASPLAKTIPAELDSGVWNIGMSVSDVFGSWLFARYHVHFMQLVWLNAGTTALTLLAVPLLPGRIVKPREEERLPPA